MHISECCCVDEVTGGKHWCFTVCYKVERHLSKNWCLRRVSIFYPYREFIVCSFITGGIKTIRQVEVKAIDMLLAISGMSITEEWEQEFFVLNLTKGVALLHIVKIIVNRPRNR